MDGLIKGTQSGTNAVYLRRKCSADEQSVPGPTTSIAASVLNLTAISPALLSKTALFLMFNRMVTAPVQVIQSVEGKV